MTDHRWRGAREDATRHAMVMIGWRLPPPCSLYVSLAPRLVLAGSDGSPCPPRRSRAVVADAIFSTGGGHPGLPSSRPTSRNPPPPAGGGGNGTPRKVFPKKTPPANSPKTRNL